MAEFCKECFMNKLLTSKERTKLEEKKIEIVMSNLFTLCEGCKKVDNFVERIVDKKGKDK